MSLATRCTHCGTIFKVVEDQLKVSEGWVRCGRCNEVFHALPTLFDLEREAPPPRTALASQPADPQVDAPADNPPSQYPSEWPATMPQSELDGPATRPPPTEAPTKGAPAASAEPSGPRVGPQPAPPQTRSWLAPVPATTEFDLDMKLAQAEPGGQAQAPQATSDPHAPNPPIAPPTPGLDDIDLDTAVELSPRADADDPRTQDLLPPLALRLSPMGENAPEANSPPPAESEDDEATAAVVSDSTPPADWDMPSRLDRVPSTEESDALDSRYLLPSSRRDRRPAARRPSDTPDFADAEVPEDWLLDAEEAELPSAPPGPAPAAAAPRAAMPLPAAVAPPSAPGFATAPSPTPEADGPTGQTTLPSRFADEPEAGMVSAAPQALESEQTTASGQRPGALRKGKPVAEPTPAFLKRAQAQARWRHPAVRAGLSVLLLGLMLALAGQMAHQFRDLIAAYHPPMRPHLAQWCELAGCKLQPPLRIEALQVDNLTFVRATSEGPDVYRLTVVLQNKAPIGLAWPHIDLSLTDLNGAVVLRRVFSPQDASWQDSTDAQPGVGQPVPEAAPGQRSTTLQWRMTIAKLQPAGYTADIFYP
jgi:predicted Zn finger-like uncharacterized protein